VAGCALLLIVRENVLAGAQRKEDAPHAVVAGAVFRENGFSLPGATVILTIKGAPKGKKLQAVSDARGEFAFRVFPEAATYVVKAALKGFGSAEKEVSVNGEERVEVTLTLQAESK
jgi:Carboxypeptidase regulatory-like domain